MDVTYTDCTDHDHEPYGVISDPKSGERTTNRSHQQPDVVYHLPDGGCFITPDGEGRYYWDDPDEIDYADEIVGEVDLEHVPSD